MVKVYNNSKDQINAALLSMNNSNSALEDQILDITTKNNKEVEAIKTEIITNNSNIINKTINTTKERFDNLIARTTRPKAGGDASWITGISQVNGIIGPDAWLVPGWGVYHYSGTVSTTKDNPTWIDIIMPSDCYYFIVPNFTGCIFVRQKFDYSYTGSYNSSNIYIISDLNKDNIINGVIRANAGYSNVNSIGIIASSNYAGVTVTLDVFLTKLWRTSGYSS